MIQPTLKKLLLGAVFALAAHSAFAAFSIACGGNCGSPTPLSQMEQILPSMEYVPARDPVTPSGACTNLGFGIYQWQLYDIYSGEIINTEITNGPGVPSTIDMICTIPQAYCQTYSRTVRLKVILPNSSVEYATGSNVVFTYKTAGGYIDVTGNYKFTHYICPSASFPQLLGNTCNLGSYSVSFYKWNGTDFSTLVAGPCTSGFCYYTPASLGRYQAVVTMAGGLVDAAEFTLVAMPPPSVEITGCGGCTSAAYTPGMTIDQTATSAAHYYVGAPGFSTYKWYRNGQLIPGATNPSYNPTAPGVYYMTAEGSCGEFTSNEITITNGVCVPTGGMIVVGTTGATTTLTPGTYSGNYFFKGKIRLASGTYNFSNMTLRMEPCASISIESAGRLSIGNSSISSCTQWAGIKVNPGCSLNINRPVIIRDAYVGILANGSAYLNIRQTTFEENHTSIAVKAKTGILASILGCTFRNMNRLPGLSCNVSNMGNFDNEFSYLYTENSSDVLSEDNAYYGWTVSNYLGNYNKDPETDASPFYAVHHVNGNRLRENRDFYYDHFNAAVYAYNAVCSLTFCTFTPSGVPVAAAGRGILLEQPGNNTLVKDNTFNYLFSGIKEKTQPTTGVTIINSNEFTDNQFAIELKDAHYVNVTQNGISNPNIGQQVGIMMTNSGEIRIRENEIREFSYGVYAFETHPYSIYDNWFDDGNYSVLSYKANYLPADDISKIGSNIFSNNYAGIIISPRTNPILETNPANNQLDLGSDPQKIVFMCNTFDNNAYGIVGSGALIDQFLDPVSGNQYMAGNLFNSNTSWDLLWDNDFNPFIFNYYSVGSTPDIPNGAGTLTFPPTLLNGIATSPMYYSNGYASTGITNCNWEPAFVSGAMYKKATGTGIPTEKLEESSFSVKPTLVENTVMISNKAGAEQRVSVTSITGQLVLESKLASGSSLELSHLNAGVYLVTITLENGSTHTERIVKQ